MPTINVTPAQIVKLANYAKERLDFTTSDFLWAYMYFLWVVGKLPEEEVELQYQCVNDTLECFNSEVDEDKVTVFDQNFAVWCVNEPDDGEILELSISVSHLARDLVIPFFESAGVYKYKSNTVTHLRKGYEDCSRMIDRLGLSITQKNTISSILRFRFVDQTGADRLVSGL